MRENCARGECMLRRITRPLISDNDSALILSYDQTMCNSCNDFFPKTLKIIVF